MGAYRIQRHEVSALPCDEAIVLFNHIPKCGGMSLHHLLYTYYGNRYLRYTPRILAPELHGIRCISGHDIWGIHTLLPQTARAFYFTLIRDPFRLAISLYRFNCYWNLEQPTSDGLERYLLSYSPNFLVWSLGQGDLQRARDVLFVEHAFWGLQEYYEQSFKQLAELLPWMQGRACPQMNVSAGDSLFCGESIKTIFFERNAQDMLLYQEAVDAFTARCEEPLQGQMYVTLSSKPHVNEVKQVVQDFFSGPEMASAVFENTLSWSEKHAFYTHQGKHEEAACCIPYVEYLCLYQQALAAYSAGKFVKALDAAATAFYALCSYDPNDLVKVLRKKKAFFLSLMCCSYMRLHAGDTIPLAYQHYVKTFAGYEELYPFFALCCAQADETPLTLFFECSGPTLFFSPSVRAQAYVLLAERCLHQQKPFDAAQHARAALLDNPYAFAAATLLAQANRMLQNNAQESLDELKKYLAFLNKMPAPVLFCHEYMMLLRRNKAPLSEIQSFVATVKSAALGSCFLSQSAALEQLSSVFNGAERIAIWGRGEFYQLYVRPFFMNPAYGQKLAYFIESSPVPPLEVEGLVVCAPQQAAANPVDIILVASTAREGIEQDARRYGLKNLVFVPLH